MEKCSIRNLLFNVNTCISILIGILLLNTLPGRCQNWQPVGNGFDYDVRCLYSDSLNNILYAGGNFKYSGNLKARAIAQWNGTNWDSLQSGMDDFHSGNPNSVISICGYQNRIIVGGGFSTAGGLSTPHLAIWDGTQWDSSALVVNGPVDFLRQINGELYLGGVFDSVGGIHSSHIAKWDGVNCSGFNFGIDSSFGGVFSIVEVNGNLFVAGNILPAAIRDLFSWNGSAVSQVGNGIHGGLAFISSMAIFNNELYVAGNFQVGNGNAGENIMRWDGVNLAPVGGGLNDYVDALKVYNGYLYASGIFDHAGGVPASRIARWDGISWSALGPEIFDNAIGCMEFFNNELYVGGGFLHADNIALNKIAKYTGPLTSVDFSKSELSFTIYPSPVTSSIILYLSSPPNQDSYIAITDLSGRKLMIETILEKNARKELNIDELTSGIYFLTLESETGKVTKKFIKQ
ncbi:MAG: T9SS type A sorting domain-containing protein [Bacteroidota bacterium]